MDTLTTPPATYLVNLFDNQFEKTSTRWELVFSSFDPDVLCESSAADDCAPPCVVNDCACK